MPSNWKALPALDPETKGLTKTAFNVPADTGVTIPFTVNPDIAAFGFSKFMNELGTAVEEDGKTPKARSANITKEPNGQGTIISSASGRDTTTDNPFCRYAATGYPHGSSTTKVVAPGVYHLNFWASDLGADHGTLGHQNN